MADQKEASPTATNERQISMVQFTAIVHTIMMRTLMHLRERAVKNADDLLPLVVSICVNTAIPMSEISTYIMYKLMAEGQPDEYYPLQKAYKIGSNAKTAKEFEEGIVGLLTAAPTTTGDKKSVKKDAGGDEKK